MRGYFWPRGTRGRLLMGAYVVVESLLGLGSVKLAYQPGIVAEAAGYILMAPTTCLALPVFNAVQMRLPETIGYSSTTWGVASAVLFGLAGLANACLITYLRTSDPRF